MVSILNNERKNVKKFLKKCGKKGYLKKIELAERELEYQILCDYVQQINDYIKENVPSHWERSWFGKLVYDLIIPSLDGIIAGALIFASLLYCGLVGGDYSSLWMKIVVSVLPTVSAVLFSVIKHKK